MLKLNRDDSKLSKEELDAKIKLTKDYYQAINEGEKNRLDKLIAFTQTDKEALDAKLKAQLTEFGLNKDVTQMTEVELKARQKIYDQYFTDVSKMNLKLVEDNLKKGKDALSQEQLQLKIAYLEDYNALGENEEAKLRLTEQYQQQELQLTEKNIQEAISTIKGELELIEENSKFNILDGLINDAEKENLLKQLEELKLKYEEVTKAKDEAEGKTTTTIVAKTKTEGKSLGESLGMDEDQIENAKLGYQVAMDSIEQIISLANQRIQRQTNERIAGVDNALKKGQISEEQAEAKKDQIRKQGLEKQKKIQKASATVNYLQGLVSAVANSMQYPFPASLIIGGIQTALLTATYASNMKQIDAQKFAEGGLIQGNSHDNGGVPFTVQGRGGFEAEGGEYIVKKSAVDAYGVSYLDALNNMKMPKMFAEGGMIPTPINNTASEVSKGIQPLADAVGSMQLEVIQVESKFTKMQNQVQNVERATTY